MTDHYSISKRITAQQLITTYDGHPPGPRLPRADGSVATSQQGTQNWLEVTQWLDRDVLVSVSQTGTGNVARADQDQVLQSGIAIGQAGNGNYAAVSQQGTFRSITSATVLQTGDGNSATIIQHF